VIDPGIPHDADAKLVEAESNFAALFVPACAIFTLEEDFHVNDGRLGHLELGVGLRASMRLGLCRFLLLLLLKDLHFG